MKKHRVPLVLASSYAAIVVFLFLLAVLAGLTGQDEFGYSAVPAIYATYPLSLVLYPKLLQSWFLAVAVGGVVNFILLWLVGRAVASRKES